ncbi:Gamma-aminobutyrate permease [Verrucomicrobia bacterium]|nr:Gamma-aminobutyrate permease [Verrucomicrobiota bacterium]
MSRFLSSPRKLSSFDIFCLGINAIIGSGIYLFPATLAREVGPASILAFGVCGLLLVFVALCYAELGSMFGQNGGSYVYAKEAFGLWVGFGVGWISWVTAIFSWAAVATAVSSNLAYFHPAFNSAWAVKGIAAVLIVGFTAINYRGIKLGAWTVNAFTLAKLAPLLFFVAVGIFYIQPARYHPFWNPPTGSFTLAVFLALWPLQGFETASLPAGESEHPQRAVPLAAIGSLVCSALIYVLIQAVAVGVHPGLANAGAKPLAEACARFLGPAGGTLMALGAVISMVGYNAGNALGSPRFLSALAEDRRLPGLFSVPHPRYQTPWAAILLTGGLTACAALFLNFQSLVDVANLVVILQYLSTCAALIWLRRQRPDATRLFKIPLGIPVALAGCVVSLWLVKEVKAREFLLGSVVIILGFAGMVAFRGTLRKSVVTQAP